MRDPYKILGINRKSSEADVKSAFRKLAKQYHPDVAGEGEMIATTFQEINAAYDILGDRAKRSQFDTGEIDANGTPVMRRSKQRNSNARGTRARAAETRTGRGGRNDRADPSNRSEHSNRPDYKSAADAWAARARAGGSRSKPDKNHGEEFKAHNWGRQEPTENLDAAKDKKRDDKSHRPRADEVFNDLFSGLKSKTQAHAQQAQAKAKSRAADKADAAQKADTNPEPHSRPQVKPEQRPEPAPLPPEDSFFNLAISFEEAARGTSRRVKLPSGKRLDVKIPAGVTPGQQIRLKGQGKGEAGNIGDALLEISVEPHRHFRCEGDDIYLTLPVSVDEATLGARVMVPTLDGPVAMTIPAGANAETTLRLKGRGLPRPTSSSEKKFGDQYVSLKVILPGADNTEFKELVEKWAVNNAYDVRSGFFEEK